MDASRTAAKRKRDVDDKRDTKRPGNSNAKRFKSQLTEAAKSAQGFKTIMSVLAKEEARNLANIEALNTPSTPTTSNKGSSSTAFSAVITGV